MTKRNRFFFALSILSVLYVLLLTTCTTLSKTDIRYPSSEFTIEFDIPIIDRLVLEPVAVPERYQQYLHDLCVEYFVPYIVVARLIKIESNFNKNALGYNTNDTYDIGIAQVNSEYLDYFKLKYFEFDPFDPYQSLKFCVNHLSSLYKDTNDWYLAVAAYNAGLGRVLRGSIPESTLRYCEIIFKDLTF